MNLVPPPTPAPCTPNLESRTLPSRLPSLEVLDNLIHLARMGAVLGIQEQAQQIEQTMPQVAAFSAQIRHYAENFQVRQLQEFLQGCREKGEG